MTRITSENNGDDEFDYHFRKIVTSVISRLNISDDIEIDTKSGRIKLNGNIIYKLPERRLPQDMNVEIKQAIEYELKLTQDSIDDSSIWYISDNRTSTPISSDYIDVEEESYIELIIVDHTNIQYLSDMAKLVISGYRINSFCCTTN
jgi:hypothetical protein